MDGNLPSEINKNLLKVTESDYSKSLKFLRDNGCGELKHDLSGALFFDAKELKDMNYKDANLSRASFQKTLITNCIFRGAALTGAKFENCVIESFDFYGADLEYSSLKNCKIALPSGFESIGFNDAFVYNCVFENTHIDNTTASNAYFKNTMFINSSIKYSTFENTLFENCVFNNFDFSMFNIDYIELFETKMENCVLPIMSMAYTIGGFDYIYNTNDNIFFKGKEEQKISLKNYRQEFPSNLITYFKGKKEYFPLANILFAQGEYDAALNMLFTGVFVALLAKDYRQIKFFCKMLKRSPIADFDTLRKFYSAIISKAGATLDSIEDYRNFVKHMAEVQTILNFPTKDQVAISFELQTNIDSSQTYKIAILLQELYFLESEIFTESHQLKITLSHSSPTQVKIDALGNEPEIKLFKETVQYVADNEKSNNNLGVENIIKSNITLAEKNVTTNININLVLVNRVISEFETNQINIMVQNILANNLNKDDTYGQSHNN